MIGGEPLDDGLARLRDAIEAARAIGLEDEAAEGRAAARRIGRRATIGGSVYVMALAGGTGVGKSSLLNALAGKEVSVVRAVRPTTDAPIAWVPGERRGEIEPLLEWLKVEAVVTHTDAAFGDVAILDLPDVDSIRPAHRALVDALLPRLDAVTWIVDPEKYDDARGHEYWRGLALHADRLRFIVNKADRLTNEERRIVVDDLRRRLVADGIPRPVIDVVSASTGEGIEALRATIADAAHAKVIVSAKLEADRVETAERLARTVGADPEAGYAPLLADDRREALIRAALDGAVSLVDPDGLARQVQAAVLHRARLGGGSLLGRMIALASALTGRRRRGADPGAYLRAWRSRGAIGRVLNPVRAALVEAAAGVPPESRGRILTALGAPSAEADVERTLDRVANAEAAALELPRSVVWPVIGFAQVVTGAIFLFGIAWIVTLFVVGGGVPVETVRVPVLGPIPLPLALLAVALVVSALLGWLLGLHAGWIGRRVAARVRHRLDEAVRETLAEAAFGGLTRVEDARRVIVTARGGGGAGSP